MKKIFLFTLCIAAVNNVMYPSRVTQDQAHTLEASIQQYCYDSYDLFTRIKRGDKENVLGRQDSAYIEISKTLFARDIDIIRSEFFTDQDESGATCHFANHLLEVVKSLHLKRYYVISFPDSVSENTSIDEQLVIIQRVLNVLLPYYTSLKPLPPFHKRFANALFYNFFTTKVVPKLILVTGFLATSAIATNQLASVIQKFDGRLPFLRYRTLNHNEPDRSTSQSATDENPMAQIFSTIIRQFTGSTEGSGACANTKGFFGAFSICKHKYCDMNNRYGNGVLHCCDNYAARCYRCEGMDLVPTPGKTFKFAWASRFMIPGLLAWYGSKIVEEAQIPEYERRIKERQKFEEEKRVEHQKKLLKINCELTVGFDKVKGQAEVIDKELKMLVDYLKHPFKYKNTSSGTRSVLLYGPPGNGKTLLARAISKESGAPFLEITADDIINENSKDKILATWRMAEEVAAQRPEKSAIIYIDEIDTVVGNRTKKDTLDPQRAKALSNLLSIFDGIEKRNPYLHIVIILTTNHYENLDPALLRPGRIDRKILIGKPNLDGRKDLFKALLPKDQQNFIDALAGKTDGFSGAQVVNVIDTANMIASYERAKRPSMQHYQQAIDRLAHEQSQMPAH